MDLTTKIIENGYKNGKYVYSVKELVEEYPELWHEKYSSILDKKFTIQVIEDLLKYYQLSICGYLDVLTELIDEDFRGQAIKNSNNKLEFFILDEAGKRYKKCIGFDKLSEWIYIDNIKELKCIAN